MKNALRSLFILGVFALVATSSVFAEDSVIDGSKVKVDYELKVDGEVVQSTFDKELNFEYQQGGDQALIGFQENLAGLKVGDKKNFTLSPEKGYGPSNPEAIQEFPKSRFPDEVEIGMLLNAVAPDGQVINALVREIKEETIVVDFNHPLAGKTLNFEIEVLEITPAAA